MTHLPHLPPFDPSEPPDQAGPTGMSTSVRAAPRPGRWRERWRQVRIHVWLATLSAVAWVAAFLLPRQAIDDLTLICYAVADVGGLAFIVRYRNTEWRSHSWGRHVMAFMVCLEVLFTLALSRRLFGDWPGLHETLLVAAGTFAGIVWWRYALLVGDGRAPWWRRSQPPPP